MISVNIICVGRLKEKYWTAACDEYAKRLKGFCNFSIIEVDEERLGDMPSDAQILSTLEKEGKRILSKVPKGAKIISMCIEGKQKSSEKLAAELDRLAVDGCSSIAFIIGGSWGLSDEVKNASYLLLIRFRNSRLLQRLHPIASHFRKLFHVSFLNRIRWW